MNWKLASGEAVLDRYNSHAHNSVRHLLPDVFARVLSQGRNFFIEEVDLDQIIGETVCVPTTDADEIVWAQRPKRFGLTRFVKNRTAEQCSKVVVILKKGDRGDYVLITAFVGSRPEPEPWDRNATPKSVEFWSTHALVWGSEEIIHGTETNQCPW